MVGDRWSLLILRDILLHGKSRFGEFAIEEGVATNILSDRLKHLVRNGILDKKPDPGDRRRFVYQPTAKGNGLAGLFQELGAWGSAHEPGSQELIRSLKHYRAESGVAPTIRSNIYRHRRTDSAD